MQKMDKKCIFCCAAQKVVLYWNQEVRKLTGLRRMTIMYDQIIERVQEQAEKFTAPLRKITEVSVAGLERVTQLNAETIRTYAELSVEHAKKVMGINIKDAESLQNFVAEQAETVHNIGLKITDDLKAYVALSEDLGEEIQKVVKENSTFIGKVTKG